MRARRFAVRDALSRQSAPVMTASSRRSLTDAVATCAAAPLTAIDLSVTRAARLLDQAVLQGLVRALDGVLGPWGSAICSSSVQNARRRHPELFSARRARAPPDRGGSLRPRPAGLGVSRRLRGQGQQISREAMAPSCAGSRCSRPHGAARRRRPPRARSLPLARETPRGCRESSVVPRSGTGRV